MLFRSYANSTPIPASSTLLREDVYRARNLKGSYDVNGLNLSYDARQEFSPYNNQNIASTALKGMVEQNPVNKLFFSSENMQRIQKKIKISVYEKSNGKFKLEEDQDESDLIIVMRSVYFDHCKNLPDNPIRQVKKLNEQQSSVASDILTVIMANEEPADWKNSIKNYCENPIDQKQERVNKVLNVAAEHQVDNYVAALLYSSRKK